MPLHCKLKALIVLVLAYAPFATKYAAKPGIFPTCYKMANHSTNYAIAGGLRLDFDEFVYPSNSSIAVSQARPADASERSIFICYSGQLRGFNGDGSAAQNHIDNFIKPLKREVGFKDVTVGFVLNHQEVIPKKIAALYNTESNVDRVVMGAVSQSQAIEERGPLHPQFLGIESCGHLILKEEIQRGRAYDFSVRMRYDLQFRDNLEAWELKKAYRAQLHSFARLVPAWPIWKTNSPIQIALFQKHYKLRTDNIQRCLPQDVFFVARAAPVPSPIGLSAAWPFLGNHTLRNHVSGDTRDHYEATLLGQAFDRGARIAVLFSCGGASCWELQEPTAASKTMMTKKRGARTSSRSHGAVKKEPTARAMNGPLPLHSERSRRSLFFTAVDEGIQGLMSPFREPGSTATSNRVPRGAFGGDLITNDDDVTRDARRGSWETRRVPVDWAAVAKTKEAERIKAKWCAEKPESVLCFAKHKGVYDERGDLAKFRRSSQIERLKDRKRQKMIDEHEMLELWCGSGKQRMTSETCVSFANGPSHREIHGMRAQTIDLSAPIRRRRRRRRED